MNTQVAQEQPAAGVDSNVSIESRAGSLFSPGGQFGPPAAPKKQSAPQAREAEGQEAQETPEPEQEQTSEGEEPASAEEAAPETPETFEFDVDGERYVLPKKLEKAVMHERDYTQKTQSLSQREKQIEFMQEQARIGAFQRSFEIENAEALQRLQAYDAVLKQQPDWANMPSDQKIETLADITRYERERASLAQDLQAKHQQWNAKLQEEIRSLNEKAESTVKQRVPNWTEETWKSIREHAKQDGYTDVELNNVADPRYRITLWKAQQFDQLKAKATKTVVDAKSVRTTSANPMPQAVKDKLAFHKAVNKTAPGSFERNRVVEQRAGSLFSKR